MCSLFFMTCSRKVAHSAKLTAAIRANESLLDKASLFFDPYARLFAGNIDINSLHFLNRLPRKNDNTKNDILQARNDKPEVVIRTKAIDDILQLEFMSESKPQQLVLLGAGFDCRAYRLSYLRDVDVFEIDVEENITYKEEIIAQNQTVFDSQFAKIISRISCDLLSAVELITRLCQHGFDIKKKTVWVCEGVLMYLFRKQALELIDALSLNCAKGSVFIADFCSKEMLYIANYRRQCSKHDDSENTGPVATTGWAHVKDFHYFENIDDLPAILNKHTKFNEIVSLLPLADREGWHFDRVPATHSNFILVKRKKENEVRMRNASFLLVARTK